MTVPLGLVICHLDDHAGPDIDALASGWDRASRCLQGSLVSPPPGHLENDEVAARQLSIEGGLGIGKRGGPTLPVFNRLVGPLCLLPGGDFIVYEVRADA